MTQDSAESLKAYSDGRPLEGAEVKPRLVQFSLGAILAAQDLQPLKPVLAQSRPVEDIRNGMIPPELLKGFYYVEQFPNQ